PVLTSLSCFFFYRSPHHRALHSFPTRRSSDLTIIVFLSYLTSLYEPLEHMTSTAQTIQEAAAEADRVSEVLELEPDVKDKPNAIDRKSTRLNSSHLVISYAVFCLKKKKKKKRQ